MCYNHTCKRLDVMPKNSSVLLDKHNDLFFVQQEASNLSFYTLPVPQNLVVDSFSHFGFRNGRLALTIPVANNC